jgi:hypothetical protein
MFYRKKPWRNATYKSVLMMLVILAIIRIDTKEIVFNYIENQRFEISIFDYIQCQILFIISIISII